MIALKSLDSETPVDLWSNITFLQQFFCGGGQDRIQQENCVVFVLFKGQFFVVFFLDDAT